MFGSKTSDRPSPLTQAMPGVIPGSAGMPEVRLLIFVMMVDRRSFGKVRNIVQNRQYDNAHNEGCWLPMTS